METDSTASYTSEDGSCSSHCESEAPDFSKGISGTGLREKWALDSMMMSKLDESLGRSSRFPLWRVGREQRRA